MSSAEKQGMASGASDIIHISRLVSQSLIHTKKLQFPLPLRARAEILPPDQNFWLLCGRRALVGSLPVIGGAEMFDLGLPLIILIIVCNGGGWGARISGQPFWKGFVVLAAAILGCFVVMTLAGSDSRILNFILTVVIAGAVGGMMRMTARQIASVLLGGIVILIPIIAAFYFILGL